MDIFTNDPSLFIFFGGWLQLVFAAIGAALGWTATTILLVSIAFQVYQASEARRRQAAMQREAEARADAAKGFKLVVEDEIRALPVVYGRALVGGNRVYSKVFNNYIYEAPDVNSVVFKASDMLSTGVISGTPSGNGVSQADTATTRWCYCIAPGLTEPIALGGSTPQPWLLQNGESTFTLPLGVLPSSYHKDAKIVNVVSGGDGGYFYTEPAWDYVWQSVIPTYPTVQWNGDNPVEPSTWHLLQRRGTVSQDGTQVTWGVAEVSTVTVNGWDKEGSHATTTQTSKFERFSKVNGVWTKDANGTKYGISGDKNEFLIMQQAICVGGIQACYQVDIDNKPIQGEYKNENDEVVYPDNPNSLPNGVTKVNYFDLGAMVYMNYNGGSAETLMTTNDDTRIYSRFTGICYATGVFRFDREEPQYNGIPVMQFYIEGKKIKVFNTRSFLGSAPTDEDNPQLAPIKVYSNNSALVLLDYLLDKDYGAGVREEAIDMLSFYKAAKYCMKYVSGGYTKPSLENKSNSVIHRAKGETYMLGLYEANLVLDTAKPIRDNIELILETMGQAELVWSAGKYKLLLAYPMQLDINLINGNTGYYTGYLKYDQVATRDVNGKLGIWESLTGTSTNWMDVTEVSRNHALVTDTNNWRDMQIYLTDADIIRANNTTATWPNAQNKYNYCTVRFLNEFKRFEEDTAVWPPKTYKLIDASSYNGTTVTSLTVSLGNKTFTTDTSLAYYVGQHLQLTDNTFGNWMQATITAYNATTGEMSVYVFFISGSGTYNSWRIGRVLTNDVYTKYLAEDNGVMLETDVFATGIVDYAHALAMAEQIVRTSRTNVYYTFDLNKEHFEIEPGDFINVTSKVMNIPGETMRVDEVSVEKEGFIKISATKFDHLSLAWNIDDEQTAPTRNVYATGLANVSLSSLRFIKSTSPGSVGTIYWDKVADTRVKKYIVKIANLYAFESTKWTDIGTTSDNFFEIPNNLTGVLVVTVVSTDGVGMFARRSGWPILHIDVVSNSGGGVVNAIDTELTVPTIIVPQDDKNVCDFTAGTLTARQGIFRIWQGDTSFTETAETTYSVASMTNCTVTINNVTGAGKGTYTVTGLDSQYATASLKVVYAGTEYVRTLLVMAQRGVVPYPSAKPPMPTNVKLSASPTRIFITMDDRLGSYGALGDYVETQIKIINWPTSSANKPTVTNSYGNFTTQITETPTLASIVEYVPDTVTFPPPSRWVVFVRLVTNNGTLLYSDWVTPEPSFISVGWNIDDLLTSLHGSLTDEVLVASLRTPLSFLPTLNSSLENITAEQIEQALQLAAANGLAIESMAKAEEALSAVVSASNTSASNLSVEATRLEGLITTLNGIVASVQEDMNSAILSNGTISNSWGVTISSQLANGDRAVTGIRLLQDTTGDTSTSAFAVMADSFRVYTPDGSAWKQVFDVSNGQVAIKGDLFVSNTIHADALVANSITANTAALSDAAITTLKLANLSVNSQKLQSGSVTYFNAIAGLLPPVVGGTYVLNQGVWTNVLQPGDQVLEFSIPAESLNDNVNGAGKVQLTAICTIFNRGSGESVAEVTVRMSLQDITGGGAWIDFGVVSTNISDLYLVETVSNIAFGNVYSGHTYQAKLEATVKYNGFFAASKSVAIQSKLTHYVGLK